MIPVLLVNKIFIKSFLYFWCVANLTGFGHLTRHWRHHLQVEYCLLFRGRRFTQRMSLFYWYTKIQLLYFLVRYWSWQHYNRRELYF